MARRKHDARAVAPAMVAAVESRLRDSLEEQRRVQVEVAILMAERDLACVGSATMNRVVERAQRYREPFRREVREALLRDVRQGVSASRSALESAFGTAQASPFVAGLCRWQARVEQAARAEVDGRAFVPEIVELLRDELSLNRTDAWVIATRIAERLGVERATRGPSEGERYLRLVDRTRVRQRRQISCKPEPRAVLRRVHRRRKGSTTP